MLSIRALFLFVLAACYCLSIATAGEGVIELTSKNFDKSIKDGNKWLIEFHGEWWIKKESMMHDKGAPTD